MWVKAGCPTLATTKMLQVKEMGQSDSKDDVHSDDDHSDPPPSPPLSPCPVSPPRALPASSQQLLQQ